MKDSNLLDIIRETHSNVFEIKAKSNGKVDTGAKLICYCARMVDSSLAEEHYDVESLLKIFTTKILNDVHYDYSRIIITYKGTAFCLAAMHHCGRNQYNCKCAWQHRKSLNYGKFPLTWESQPHCASSQFLRTMA